MEVLTIKTTSEDLSPEEYLKLLETDRGNIEDVKIVPAELGTNNFGKIQVNYKIPVYKVRYE